MASRSQFNSKSPTIKRILREASELANAPSPDYTAEPLESDLFEWHFTLRGPPSSAFAEGIYHGRIVLPPTYPLRPPSFRFLTPSGRFETNREICLSISGHHEETWQPAWGLRTALVALRSFMETDAKGQLGGLETGEAVRKRMAGESLAWKCASCGKSNEEILKECAEAAKANEKDGQGKKAEEVVPEELKLGFKDEMEKRKEGVVAESYGRAEEDEESAELAEGFVQTGPVVAAVDSVPASGPVPAAAYPPARPAQSVPQPTATIPIPVQQTVQVQATQQRQRQSNDGIPLWIDRTIAGIVVCLIFMVLKVLIGSKFLI